LSTELNALSEIAARDSNMPFTSLAHLLSALYEQDFLGVSYGFRPEKSGHDALKTLELSIMKGGVNYLIDVDIKGY
jgi:retron-type reverse transcriptase